MISIAGISVVAILAAARSASPVGLPVRVVWDAPAGCSDSDSFFAAVASRAERIHRAEPGEDGARIEVKLARLGTKVHGELRLVTDDGKSDLRKVDGATCEEVADALSLTAALALSAAAHAAATPPPAGQGTAPGAGPSAPAPAAVVPVAPPIPAPGPPAPPPTLFPVLPPSAPPASPPSAPSAPAPAPPPQPLAAPEPPPVAPGAASGPTQTGPVRSLASWLSVGLGPAAGEVVSPYFSFGGMASLRVEEPEQDRLAPSATLGFLYLRTDLLSGGDEAVFRLAAATVTACPGWGFRGSLASVELCALGVGGWLLASDAGVTVSRSVSRSWWSAGALLRARAPVGAGFAVQLDASASIPLVQRRFVTTTPEETVGTSAGVAPLFAISVTHGL